MRRAGRVPNSATEKKHCARCNSWIDAKHERCPNCLAPLPALAWQPGEVVGYCPACASPNPVTASFCGQCGQRLEPPIPPR